MNWTDTLNGVLEAGVPTDRFAMFATVDPEGHPRVRSVVVRSLSGGARAGAHLLGGSALGEDRGAGQ